MLWYCCCLDVFSAAYNHVDDRNAMLVKLLLYNANKIFADLVDITIKILLLMFYCKVIGLKKQFQIIVSNGFWHY